MTQLQEGRRGPTQYNELAARVENEFKVLGVTEKVRARDLTLIYVVTNDSELKLRYPFNEQASRPQILVYHPNGLPEYVRISAYQRNGDGRFPKEKASDEKYLCLNLTGVPGHQGLFCDGLINQSETDDRQTVCTTEIGEYFWAELGGGERAIPLLVFKQGLTRANLMHATSVTLPNERTQNVPTTAKVEHPRPITDREAINRLVQVVDSMPEHDDWTLPHGTKIGNVGSNLVEARILAGGEKPVIRFNYEVDRNLLAGFLDGCENPNASLEFLGIKPGWIDKTHLFVNLDLRPSGKLEILVGEVDVEGEADMSQAFETSPWLLKRILDLTRPGYPANYTFARL